MAKTHVCADIMHLLQRTLVETVRSASMPPIGVVAIVQNIPAAIVYVNFLSHAVRNMNSAELRR